MAVQNLADSVDYQPGSVVSRIVLKNSGGTVTAFAFDVDQGLSEHTTPFEALIQVVDGEATITIGGSAHTVRAGQWIRLPANVPHAVNAPTRVKMILTMLKG